MPEQRVGQQHENFLKAFGMEDQTDEDSVEAVSDGEDTGFTEEESVPEEKTEQKTEDSGRQLLMIIPTLLAVCIMAFAAIFVLCKKRR